MESIVWIAAALGAAVLLASVWSGWRHRARLTEMQRRLDLSQQSRGELERLAKDLDLRLASTLRTLDSFVALRQADAPGAAGPGAHAERSRAAQLQSASEPDTQPNLHLPWRDTESLPVDPPTYAETLPMALDPEGEIAPPAGGTSPLRS